jgi:hypothetical protein
MPIFSGAMLVCHNKTSFSALKTNGLPVFLMWSAGNTPSGEI